MAGTTHSVTMEDGGRVAVPAEICDRVGLFPGAPLILVESPGGLVVMTREQLLTRVRADLADVDLVGELLGERRSASAREDLG
jgi:bifunctional DNA-binding transcriptional regulator/antitoxin component of YhaV-PrlF toxin-antitoxin module